MKEYFLSKMKSNVVLQSGREGRLFLDANNNDGVKDKGKAGGYGLRPRAGKGESSSRRGSSKGQSSAAPLSKYRRRTANARERTRMREINGAFEALRRCVGGVDGAETAGGERMTKISTLRLAAQYIAALAAALAEPPTTQPLSAPSPDFSYYSDLSASLSPDFHDAPFSPDFPDAPLSPDFTDRSLSPFDPFFSEFS